MAAKDVNALLLDILGTVAVREGFELCDVEYLKEGQHWYVRIYIDKEGGVTVDDCERMSRKAEALLDEKDPIAQAYILEVSSPGLDRALKKDADYAKYTGRVVDIKLYKAIHKQKMFQGTLIGLKDGVVSIEDADGAVHAFARADIASCKLAVFF